MENLAQEVGARLRKLRKSRDESLVHVAVSAGLSPSTLWRYEKGKFVPSGQALKDLAAHFGVSSDEILGAPEAAA